MGPMMQESDSSVDQASGDSSTSAGGSSGRNSRLHGWTGGQGLVIAFLGLASNGGGVGWSPSALTNKTEHECSD